MQTPNDDLRSQFKAGSVFQINEQHNKAGGRYGWVGVFVMATDIRAWGIVGFVSHVEKHDTQRQAYVRLEWSDVDYIGEAALVQMDAV